VEKKSREIAEELEALKELTHLDESERILIARSLVATPDERWAMNRAFLRSAGLLRISDRRKFGFKSPE
jgi:hypothetical protein